MSEKNNVASKGMRVDMNKTKVMISGERQKVKQNAVRWPCEVCSKAVGSKSFLCVCVCACVRACVRARARVCVNKSASAIKQVAGDNFKQDSANAHHARNTVKLLIMALSLTVQL